MGDASTFRGYGPEQGYAFLRETIVAKDYTARGIDIAPDEVFVSDGAKSDTGNFGDILGPNNVIAVTDPVYPVYVDTNAMNAAKASAKTVQALAAALKQRVDTASNLNFSSIQAGSLGMEPAVIGAASASKPNVLSAPVKGKAGVYVFSVVSEQQRNDKFNPKVQIDMLNSRYNYMLPYM